MKRPKEMILTFVVAVADNNAIGKDNALPWHLPGDLKFFKNTTMGKPVIMGRNTWESLKGKPLPGRENLVLSSRTDMEVPEGVKVFGSIKDAIAYLEEKGTEEASIIGGGKVFEETQTIADKMYITRVHAKPEADVFFMDVDHTHWKLTWSEPHQADEKNKYDYTFELYERIEL